MASNPKKPRYVFNPPADRLKAMQDQAVALRNDMMEYLTDLNAAGRQQQSRLSTDDIVFTEDSLRYSSTHAQFAPEAVDLQGFAASMAGIDNLLSVSRTVTELSSFMDHSEMVMRTDAYKDARGYYKGVRVGSELGSPGAEAIARDLGRAFERKSSSTAPAPVPAPAPAPNAGSDGSSAA